MKKDKKLTLVGLLIISIILMTIVFALVSQTLTINGSAKMNPSNWDIHFEKIDEYDLTPELEPIITGKAEVKTEAKIKPSTTDIGDYEITLTRPSGVKIDFGHESVEML